jgi:hypothetical protein
MTKSLHRPACPQALESAPASANIICNEDDKQKPNTFNKLDSMVNASIRSQFKCANFNNNKAKRFKLKLNPN